jgi:hypothetical protein
VGPAVLSVGSCDGCDDGVLELALTPRLPASLLGLSVMVGEPVIVGSGLAVGLESGVLGAVVGLREVGLDVGRVLVLVLGLEVGVIGLGVGRAAGLDVGGAIGLAIVNTYPSAVPGSLSPIKPTTTVVPVKSKSSEIGTTVSTPSSIVCPT